MADAPVSSEQYVKLYEQGCFGDALIGFQELANREHADSQRWLGRMYAAGEGVAEDEERADYWNARAAENFRVAASRGDANAQYELGLMYEDGEGVPESSVEAMRLYRLAAEQGHADAHMQIAVLYDVGAGVEQDELQASKYVEMAAQLGSADALSEIGGEYLLGVERTENLARAKEFLSRAAELGDYFGIESLGRHYFFNPNDRDFTEARAWYSRAAEAGLVDSQYMLGRMLVYSLGGPAGVDEGIEILETAARSGHCASCLVLGDLYATGDLVAQDDGLASDWYRKPMKDDKLDEIETHGNLYTYGDRGGCADREVLKLALMYCYVVSSTTINNVWDPYELLSLVEPGQAAEARQLAIRWADAILG